MGFVPYGRVGRKFFYHATIEETGKWFVPTYVYMLCGCLSPATHGWRPPCTYAVESKSTRTSENTCTEGVWLQFGYMNTRLLETGEINSSKPTCILSALIQGLTQARSVKFLIGSRKTTAFTTHSEL